MADLHGVVEVFHELCVPHFYHATRNSLTINELHILHREVSNVRYDILKLQSFFALEWKKLYIFVC